MLSRKTSLLMGFLVVFITVISAVQAQTTTVTTTITSTATTITTSTRTSTSTVGGATPCSGFCPQSGFQLGSLSAGDTSLVVIALIAVTIAVIMIGISQGKFRVRS